MVVLEQLNAPQRVAFVLRDALTLPFTEIAEVLGCTEATARPPAPERRLQLGDLRVGDGHRLGGHGVGVGRREPLGGLVEGVRRRPSPPVG